MNLSPQTCKPPTENPLMTKFILIYSSPCCAIYPSIYHKPLSLENLGILHSNTKQKEPTISRERKTHNKHAQ